VAVRSSRGAGDGVDEDDGEFSWDRFVACMVHPVQVEIVEAFVRLGGPLSASDLHRVFGMRYETSNLKYHLGVLSGHGAVERVDSVKVRGATKTMYELVAKPELP
jgi:hypothetical protein